MKNILKIIYGYIQKKIRTIKKFIIKKNYYEMQKPNLLYPNEAYINDVKNVNKADFVRMSHVYNDNLDIGGGICLI